MVMEQFTGNTLAEPLKKDNQYLQRKFALITGGSRGIGRGIALNLARKGATVAVNYIKDEVAANDTLACIRQFGSDGFIEQADVSVPDELSAMIEQVRKQFGQLDIY